MSRLAAHRRAVVVSAVLLRACMLGVLGCSSDEASWTTVEVNSLEDTAEPAPGTVTLRAALARSEGPTRITFAPALDGGTIALTIVGERHSILKGEVYAGGPPQFQGYQDRDYGRSALYVRKDLAIDASALPSGITIAWAGGDAEPARVLAVYGDLWMDGVTIRSGRAVAEPIVEGSQPYTLGRGGGLAVWGWATLRNCTVSGNRAEGDTTASRDRGAYGGGIYANGLSLAGCVVSGNSAIGYGAAGGGIYSVGGGDNRGGRGNTATLTGTVVSGNRVTAQHAYGGGIFSLSGGPDNLAWMRLESCTVARNLVEDHPALAESGQWYYRGGGIYMGGGSLSLVASTVVENEVEGPAAEFGGKPNRGGGGVAATIGNAHVVENVLVQQSIVAGNRVGGVAADWYSGSLLEFTSFGHNLLGVLDFSQILVPVPLWMNLGRKHHPKVGDRDGVALGEVVALGEIGRHASILSAGVDAGEAAVLWYPPAGSALDAVPASYAVTVVHDGYEGSGVPTDDFLNHVLAKLRAEHGDVLGADFGTGFGDLTGVTFHGPGVTWPANPENAEWIAFWRALDVEIDGRLGAAGLGDDFWGSFETGPIGNDLRLTVTRAHVPVAPPRADQLGNARPSGAGGDVGAIER
jgi:hypothetical protein